MSSTLSLLSLSLYLVTSVLYTEPFQHVRLICPLCSSGSDLLVGVVLTVGTSSASFLQVANLFKPSRPVAIFDWDSAQVAIPSTTGGEGHSFSVKFPSKAGLPHYCVKLGAEACLAWGKSATLLVTKQENGRHSISLTSNQEAQICFNIKNQHLYGGPILNVYPQEKSSIENRPYITADFTRFSMMQAVAERFWYTSSGLNIKVDPESPLFLTQNEDQLCLIANNTFPYPSDSPVQLNYETCVESRNMREGVRCFFDSYEKPIPPAQVVGSPIWSTWVEFKKNVTQENSISFFNEIRSHNLRLSVMEIDDEWETCYGSQVFSEKFPDPKAMVDLFHDEGYLTTLWVHPFIGPGCKSIDQYIPYLAKYPNGTIGITEWWNGKNAHVINFTDPNAIEWYEQRLFNIQRMYGFDSFKFDAGEVAYIPGMSVQEGWAQIHHPNQFTTNYVRTAEKFGTLAEIRVGSEAHDFKLMQRLQDTNSVWDAERWGLRSVIPSVLQLSLHGYGAILPDMIGGNSYEDQMPSKEMFIRWIQLNTFLPMIQFSLAPWKFDQETVDVTRKFTDLHYEYKDRILKEFHDESHPVINPIWWIAAEDEVAQVIDNEFLLGETLLVAPVVEEGAVSRDIYLPIGKWRDANTGTVHIGPTWLHGYSAPLEVLPYFEAQPQE